MVRPCTRMEKATTAKATVTICARNGTDSGRPSASARENAPRRPPHTMTCCWEAGTLDALREKRSAIG